MDTLGGKLKQLRKAAGLSQGQVAEYAGVSQSTISDIEGDKISPKTITAIVRLAGYYKRTTDYLLGVTEETEQKPLPEGATEIVEYLNGMSDRGREQLLKVARILSEEDQDYKQKLIVARFVERGMDETTFEAFSKELATVYAETGDFEITISHLRKAFGNLNSGNLDK